jgi:hypothetical protein
VGDNVRHEHLREVACTTRGVGGGATQCAGSGSTVTLDLEVTSPLLFGVVGKALQSTFKKKLTATLDGLAAYLEAN